MTIIDELEAAVSADDLAALARILGADPGLFAHRFSHGGEDLPLTAWIHRSGGSAAALKRVIALGGDIHDLDAELFGKCEGHDLEGTRLLLDVGVDPNDARNHGWDCDVLYGWVQTYHPRGPVERKHEGIELLIEHGARFQDGPFWDLQRGRLDRLEQRLRQDPGLVHEHLQLDCGNFVTLRGVTLLHVAAEYNEREAAELLLRHGADLDAKADVGANGIGGHTPLFHTIGNQRSLFPMFQFLVESGADLAVTASLPAAHFCEDPVNKAKDHFFDDVRTLTPLAYCRLIEQEHPGWRDAAREAAVLRQRGAPE